MLSPASCLHHSIETLHHLKFSPTGESEEDDFKRTYRLVGAAVRFSSQQPARAPKAVWRLVNSGNPASVDLLESSLRYDSPILSSQVSGSGATDKAKAVTNAIYPDQWRMGLELAARVKAVVDNTYGNYTSVDFVIFTTHFTRYASPTAWTLRPPLC